MKISEAREGVGWTVQRQCCVQEEAGGVTKLVETKGVG